MKEGYRFVDCDMHIMEPPELFEKYLDPEFKPRVTSSLRRMEGGTVLLTEVPEFCGAEHILAHRAKDFETGKKIYALVDWFKEYASKFGAVLNQNPSAGNIK